MTDDTARRERAEKWMMDDSETAKVEWKLAWDAAEESRFIADSDRRLLIAYLAGAREEAAIAAAKLRSAAREIRTPFGEALAHLADEIEEGR